MNSSVSPLDARYCYIVVTSSASECEDSHVTTCNVFYSIQDVNQFMLNWKFRTNDTSVVSQVIVYFNGQAMNAPHETIYLVSSSDIGGGDLLVLWRCVKNVASNIHSQSMRSYLSKNLEGFRVDEKKGEAPLFEFRYHVSHKSRKK